VFFAVGRADLDDRAVGQELVAERREAVGYDRGGLLDELPCFELWM
jgi:hypothetical protein